SVATWLHGLAVWTARDARRTENRRRLREQKALQKKTGDSSSDVSLRETCGFLEEEIALLPDKYRTPLIQCELLNRHREDGARELGCAVRTRKRRVQGAKALLHKRLAARGLTLTSILLSLMLSPASEAAVPPELAANTFRGLLLFIRGQEVVAATSDAANPVA